MSANRTVLITGSSSGIGRATVHLFQNYGWNVIATMRNPEANSEFELLDNVLPVRLDVLDKESISKAVEQGIQQFGSIDALVNNAGYGSYGPLEATTDEEIERQLNTNVLGVYLTSKAVIPHFRSRTQGTIVNVGSMVGKFALPLGSLYCTSKFAVDGLSEALSYEMSTIGVKVRLIEPGSVKTDFAGRSLQFSNDESLQEYQSMIQAVFQARGDFKESGIQPEQVAEVIYQSVTDESDKLRYPVGPDAESILATRSEVSDYEFMNMVRELNGISDL